MGKSIRIYLPDGATSGLRHAELVNWTGQAIACPRNRVGELTGWKEAHKPGVYFLFGFDANTGQPMAYVGEAQNVFIRLQQHIVAKEFWNEVVFFSSKDENLTDGHVRYLESRLINTATQAKRFKLENGTQPQLPPLPAADRDAMEEFIEYSGVLLGVLGYKILEPILGKQPTTFSKDEEGDSKEPSNEKLELFLSTSGIQARGILTDEGIVVLAGSQAAFKASEGLPPGYLKLRVSLIEDGVLGVESENYIFTTDHVFNSPSAAACVALGYSINGRQHWKDKEGRSLKQIEEDSAG